MTLSNHEIWQSILAEMELTISKPNFNTWFKNTGITSFQNGEVVICVPNTFNKAWLEKKYHHSIIKSLERITGKPIKKLEYKINNIRHIAEQIIQSETNYPQYQEEQPEIQKTSSFEETSSSSSPGFVLNSKYNFNNFVVGKGTELAHAAAEAVTAKPGESYNPLFIYGGVGLGKTHLIQAIGNKIREEHPDFNIMYVSAEKFSNDFIDSIKNGTAKDFQNLYRSIDLLLIDDIQFIAGKDRTQESFFHTFNDLHQLNKQVVLTSDRPPKAIPALEDRLKSRFEWGMIADVGQPDFETRVAILETKCSEKNFALNDKIIQTIATIIQNNIRELEGALNKIIVYHQLKNTEPTIESVKSLLATMESAIMRRSLTPQFLVETVTSFYGIPKDGVLSKNREKKLSNPRQIIMYLLREELRMSFPNIGEELGGRDHTTAMHAYTKIKKKIDNDAKLKQDIDLIKQRLYINNV